MLVLVTANGWPSKTYLTVWGEIQTAVRLLALPCRMHLSLFRARWPECCVGHDARGWVLSANGWTPMRTVPATKHQHIAREAREHRALTM